MVPVACWLTGAHTTRQEQACMSAASVLLQRRRYPKAGATAFCCIPSHQGHGCNRSALDRVMEKGGFVSVMAGTAPDADSLAVNHSDAEKASITLPASAVVRAWLRAPTVQRTCLLAPSWFTSPCPQWVVRNVVAVLARWLTSSRPTSATAPCSVSAPMSALPAFPDCCVRGYQGARACFLPWQGRLSWSLT